MGALDQAIPQFARQAEQDKLGKAADVLRGFVFLLAEAVERQSFLETATGTIAGQYFASESWLQIANTANLFNPKEHLSYQKARCCLEYLAGVKLPISKSSPHSVSELEIKKLRNKRISHFDKKTIRNEDQLWANAISNCSTIIIYYHMALLTLYDESALACSDDSTRRQWKAARNSLSALLSHQRLRGELRAKEIIELTAMQDDLVEVQTLLQAVISSFPEIFKYDHSKIPDLDYQRELVQQAIQNRSSTSPNQ